MDLGSYPYHTERHPETTCLLIHNIIDEVFPNQQTLNLIKSLDLTANLHMYLPIERKYKRTEDHLKWHHKDTISQIWSGAAIEHRFLQQVYCKEKKKKMEGEPTDERDLKKSINQLQNMDLFPSWFKETKNIMKQLRKEEHSQDIW